MRKTESDTPDENELAIAYRSASENAETLSEEWGDVSSEAWRRLEK